jgi:IMP dehydrogenase/GMP reductase
METLPNPPAKPAPGPVVVSPAHPSAGAQAAHRAVTPKIMLEGITFDDVLLVPARSAVLPADADTSTRLTAEVTLNIPLISAPMDTVTESRLAIALAQEGGIGIIHKNLSAETQAREVAKVKRSAHGVITDPVTLHPDDSVRTAVQLMRKYNVSGFPVTTDQPDADHRSGGRVVGILTRRDLKFVESEATLVRGVMTADGLITAPPGTTLAEAELILNKNKVEKLLLVDANGHLAGLITMRDIDRLSQFPRANTRRARASPLRRRHRRHAVRARRGAPRRRGRCPRRRYRPRPLRERPPHRPRAQDSAPSVDAVQVIAGNIATAEGRQRPRRRRRRRRQGRHRARLHLHHPRRHRRRRAADHRHHERLPGVAETGRDIPVIADGGIRTPATSPRPSPPARAPASCSARSSPGSTSPRANWSSPADAATRATAAWAPRAP